MNGWNHLRPRAGDLLRDVAILLVRVADRVDPPSPVRSWWMHGSPAPWTGSTGKNSTIRFHDSA